MAYSISSKQYFSNVKLSEFCHNFWVVKQNFCIPASKIRTQTYQAILDTFLFGSIHIIIFVMEYGVSYIFLYLPNDRVPRQSLQTGFMNNQLRIIIVSISRFSCLMISDIHQMRRIIEKTNCSEFLLTGVFLFLYWEQKVFHVQWLVIAFLIIDAWSLIDNDDVGKSISDRGSSSTVYTMSFGAENDDIFDDM